MNGLRTALEQFDGTHTAPLRVAKNVARSDLDGLIALCDVPNVAVAATWVVKALIEDGTVVDLAKPFATLGRQSEWAAQLHLLQCVQVTPEQAVPQVAVIRGLLAADKALVRVWALDAFVRIAEKTPSLRGEARDLVTAALDAKAASLRARARDLKVICAGW